jgi:hypothetical protein
MIIKFTVLSIKSKTEPYNKRRLSTHKAMEKINTNKIIFDTLSEMLSKKAPFFVALPIPLANCPSKLSVNMIKYIKIATNRYKTFNSKYGAKNKSAIIKGAKKRILVRVT